MSETNHFTIVKQRVDLEDYLTNELGVQLVAEGRGTTACCPFHDEDTPSFKVTETDDGWKRWHCFGACQEGGTIVDAVMKAEGYELPNEAVRYLNDLYSLGLEIDDAAYREFAKAVKETEQEINKTTHALEDSSKLAATAKKYLNNRGLNDEGIAHFELGIDTEFTKTGRVSIPLRDSQNHPISIALRALYDGWDCSACGQYVEAREMVKQAHQAKKAAEAGEELDWKHCPHCQAPDAQAKIAWLYYQHPKYRFRGGFEKREFLYNEYHSRVALRQDPAIEGLFVSEGYGEVWAGWMADSKAYVSYSGASLSDWQAQRLIRLTGNKEEKLDRPIILVPDFDSTGLAAIHKNIAAIRQFSETQEIQVVHGIDKCTYTDHEGNKVACKDLGDVLKHFGPEKVKELLTQRMPAAEWQIKDIITETNPHTGRPFHSVQRQMHLVAGILSNERSKAALDHLIPYLAQAWNSPLEAIRQWFYSNLTADNATSYQHLFKDVEQARIEAREFLQDDNVIGTGFESIDRALPGDGMRPGQLAMVLGKALSVDSKILTTTGWKRMGDMEVGDWVVDPDGGRGQVTGVFPQGQRQLYRVTFSDGASVECDREHLWHTFDYQNRQKVQTLGQIIDSGKIGRSEQYHLVYIPVTEPVEMEDSPELPIDPYVLGAILGDGSLRSERQASFTATDKGIVSAVSARLPDPVQLTAQYNSDIQFNLSCRQEERPCPNPLTRALREFGLLGLKSHEKFVPEIYLQASIEDRLQLLRGLMDTDGSAMVYANGYCCSEFCSVSKSLADAVVYLTRSLGGTAISRESAAGYRRADGEYVKCKNRHRVRVTMPPELNPYLTPTKADIWKRAYKPKRRITAIEPVGEKEAQCITVDTKRSLYITDDFIVTHNSGTGKALSLRAQLLAPDGQWISMADIAVGDQLLDPATGESCSVTGVYPQGPRQLYRVEFNDGTTVDCDLDHLWAVKIDGQWRAEPLSSLLSISEPIEVPVLASRAPDGKLLRSLGSGWLNPSQREGFIAHYRGTRATEVAEMIRACGGVARVSGQNEVDFTLPAENRHLVGVGEPQKFIVKISKAEVEEAQCIAVDSQYRTYVTDHYTVTHNTMLSTQLLANFAEQGKRSIFFTLEQASKSLYPRLACQVLGMSMADVEVLIKSDDPADEEKLKPVNEIYENMLLIDNVPTETQKALPMTPNRIKAMIQEANLTHFQGEGANIVLIDYLSILQPNEDAPHEIKSSDDRVPGYNMLSLFEICKELNVLMIVLQQLPKEVKKGVPFSYDSGRGGSRQTDACDYIFCIWRPDQNEELSEEDRLAKAGQYKIALGKNRYGASTVEHAMFDSSCLRILPPIEISMPDQIHNEALIEIAEDDESSVPPELRIKDDDEVSERVVKSIAQGEAGKNAEALEALAEATDTYPQDAEALLADISADDDGEIDPDLRSIFES